MDSAELAELLVFRPDVPADPAASLAPPDPGRVRVVEAQPGSRGGGVVEQLHHFSCRICGKTFGKTGAVVAHMRVHSMERRYSCNFCDMKFKDGNTLRQHVRRHTGERPYKCSDCEKAFKQQSGLIQHKRLHTGERPYECQFCQRTFVQKNHVDRHERAHTGDKPYTCTSCGAAFVDRSGLNQHVRKHGEEPVNTTPAGMAPRGSGRPKKVREDVVELETPVSGKRERKRKELHPDVDELTTPAVVRTVVRGRGRPRKEEPLILEYAED